MRGTGDQDGKKAERQADFNHYCGVNSEGTTRMMAPPGVSTPTRL